MCPNCGQTLADPNATQCQNCGFMLANPTPPQQSQDATPSQVPLAPNQPPYAIPPSVPYAANQPPYILQPSVPYTPNQPPYSAPLPPGYGQFPVYGPPTGSPPSAIYPPPTGPWTGMPPAWGVPEQQAPPPSHTTRNIFLAIGGAIVLTALVVSGIFLVALNGGHPGSSATNGTSAVATPTATPGENVVFHDPLTSNTNGWANDTHCFFKNGGYHIKSNYLCYAPAGDFADATVSVDVKQISGDIHWFYGLLVRRASVGNYYLFEIDGNGKWRFSKVANDKFSDVLPYVPNSAIKTGLNVVNTLKIQMSGSHFTFSINGTQVGQTDDTTFTTGKCGVEGNDHDEVVFNNFSIATPA